MAGGLWHLWGSQEATATCDSEPGQWQRVRVPVWAVLDTGQQPRVAVASAKVSGAVVMSSELSLRLPHGPPAPSRDNPIAGAAVTPHGNVWHRPGPGRCWGLSRGCSCRLGGVTAAWAPPALVPPSGTRGSPAAPGQQEGLAVPGDAPGSSCCPGNSCGETGGGGLRVMRVAGDLLAPPVGPD